MAVHALMSYRIDSVIASRRQKQVIILSGIAFPGIEVLRYKLCQHFILNKFLLFHIVDERHIQSPAVNQHQAAMKLHKVGQSPFHRQKYFAASVFLYLI